MTGFASGRKRERRTVNEINMIPLIDLMLVLLIIFMVTAPMLTPGVIDVPTVGKGSQQPIAVANVSIDKNGGLEWTANGQSQSIDLAELGEQARDWQASQQAESGVGISADKQVQYEEVVKVFDALKQAGVERVGLNVNVNQGGQR
ncbi:Cell division and transport-associated protein TolR (TC 2.C.1.2.1) [Lampropedia hyalina DSM 16112]|jgi:biopolymer transport protein TolR|uniref:Cell division and transport-associated protein TolR (TC 2.C.1.2.1) n=1 Tax=Lampropedia hyalina DSM 16112 TaxID=1122156 RepID=A0A1M5FCT5_9BURK|nr:biopolymer transporter ExbD [Lampropedia hyalina]SHF88912.1 Cell division and transport-associated protein TolR (TC 2.C.1.2.1) [Lampropedia hyalina DSM 16112]